MLIGIPCLIASILITFCVTFGGLALEFLPIIGDGMVLFGRGLAALLIMVRATSREIFAGIALKISQIQR